MFWKSGSSYLGKACTAEQEQRYPVLPVCVQCFRVLWQQWYMATRIKFFNVRTNVAACDCTRGYTEGGHRRGHRCGTQKGVQKGVYRRGTDTVRRTPKESMHWELTLGEKSHVAPGTRTRVSIAPGLAVVRSANRVIYSASLTWIISFVWSKKPADNNVNFIPDVSPGSTLARNKVYGTGARLMINLILVITSQAFTICDVREWFITRENSSGTSVSKFPLQWWASSFPRLRNYKT